MGIGLVLVALGVYGLMRPAKYKAQARIRLVSLNVFTSYDPYFIQTEIETIQSDLILSNVVFRLDLDSRSGKNHTDSEALALLRRRLDVRWGRDPTLVSIYMVHENATEAAKIANTIAEVYRDWRQERVRRLVEGGIAELVKQLKLQEQIIQKAEDNLNGLRRTLAIPSPEPSDDFLRSNFPQYHETKKHLDDEKAIKNLLARKTKREQEELNLPRGSEVVIVERAVPPTTPLRFYRHAGATLLLVGLAFFGWGIVIIRNSKTSDPLEST